jgi:hypothetical protein
MTSVIGLLFSLWGYYFFLMKALSYHVFTANSNKWGKARYPHLRGRAAEKQGAVQKNSTPAAHPPFFLNQFRGARPFLKRTIAHRRRSARGTPSTTAQQTSSAAEQPYSKNSLGNFFALQSNTYI